MASIASDTHAAERSEVGKTDKKLSRARAHNTEFLFFSFTHRK